MDGRKRPVTIHDIARELGLASSTVSRALKNNGRISPTTREAVIKLAQKYNYQPNTMASSLRMGKGNTVGVIVPNINRSFFSNIIGGMEEVFSKAGYNLIICQSQEQIENEKECLKALFNARVDGILMSLSMETMQYDHITEILQNGVRMVFFDRVPDLTEVSTVTINDEEAAFRITAAMIRNGCRSLAHIGGSKKINVYADRRAGFLRAIRHYDLEIPEKYMIEAEMTREGGAEAFRQLVKLQPRPDAIICSGDFTALGVMRAAHDVGISVPEELAVSGFANEEFTGLTTPEITTVDQKGMEIGRRCASMYLENESLAVHEVIEPEIIFRSSTMHVNTETNTK